jgi:Tol biopolymer transport system component
MRIASLAAASLLLLAQSPEKPSLFEGSSSLSVGAGITFSPDGNTFYVAQDRSDIMVSDFRNGKWSSARPAEFSGTYRDGDPFVSPDGSQLFFWSTRPLNGRLRKNMALWVVEKSGAGWSSPRDLGSSINGTDGGPGFPAVASNGNLYFMDNRPDSIGGLDVYWAKRTGGGYSMPQNLGPVINSPHSDFDAFIAPDESYIVFASDRPGGLGGGDLYISRRRYGSWSPPRNLGPKINSAGFECCPSVSPDGTRFYFTTQGLGRNGIYEVSIAALDMQTGQSVDNPKLFAEGPISSAGSMSISFAPDGKTAYFAEAGSLIIASHWQDGEWSYPARVEFSGRFFDFGPSVAPDGSRLLFSSSRARAGQKLSLGLWVAERDGARWGTPKDLGPEINGVGEGAGSPSVARNGTVYFVADRPGSVGGLDIFRARRDGDHYMKPENLGPGINSPEGEYDVYVSPDERLIVFASDRPGGMGDNDLYISMSIDGGWTTPRNLGPSVNSAGAECCASMSPDGRWLYFNGNAAGKPGIYRISVAVLSQSGP